MVVLQKEQDIDQLWAGTRRFCQKDTGLGFFPSEEAWWKWQGRVRRMHLGGNESQVSYAWEGGLPSTPSNVLAKGRVLGIRNSELPLSPSGSRSQKWEPCSCVDIVLLNKLLVWEQQEGLGSLQVDFWFSHSFLMSLSKGCRVGG